MDEQAALTELRSVIELYVPAGSRDDDGIWHDGPHRESATAALDSLAAELAARADALGQAVDVIQWSGENDKTPRYTYDPTLKSTARADGTLPGAGRAFNTPREFARYWVPKLRETLGRRT